MNLKKLQVIFFSAVTNRNYLAVTGAVLMVRKKLFDKVEGFSEIFPINYNDIDFCLKLHKLNKRNVFTANAQLYHFESISREAYVSKKEINLFLKNWKKYLKNISRDPYYSTFHQTKPPNFKIKV